MNRPNKSHKLSIAKQAASQSGVQTLTAKLGEQMAKGAELDALIRKKLGGGWGMSSDLPDLPAGWSFASLESCSQKGSITYGIVQPGSQTNGGVPIIRVNNFRDTRIDVSDVMKVTSEIAAKYARTPFERWRGFVHCGWHCWTGCCCAV
jgi:hypothetical protein